MDTVTHIVLGACVGDAVLGQKVGKKALIAGAIAQSIPDIDFISALWLSPAEQLLAHMGITHSFFIYCCICTCFRGHFSKASVQTTKVQSAFFLSSYRIGYSCFS